MRSGRLLLEYRSKYLFKASTLALDVVNVKPSSDMVTGSEDLFDLDLKNFKNSLGLLFDVSANLFMYSCIFVLIICLTFNHNSLNFSHKVTSLCTFPCIFVHMKPIENIPCKVTLSVKTTGSFTLGESVYCPRNISFHLHQAKCHSKDSSPRQ